MLGEKAYFELSVKIEQRSNNPSVSRADSSLYTREPRQGGRTRRWRYPSSVCPQTPSHEPPQKIRERIFRGPRRGEGFLPPPPGGVFV